MIAAEAGGVAVQTRARVAGATDPFVAWLLLLGGFVFLVGWLVGAVLTFLPFGLLVLTVLIVAPIIVAVHLERVRRRHVLG